MPIENEKVLGEVTNEVPEQSGSLVKGTKHDYADIIEFLASNGVLAPADATPDSLLKLQTQVITVLKREVNHLLRATYELDNRHRSYLRKNIPVNLDKAATPQEIELIHAEQRFINAAVRCAPMIGGGDDGFEFKLALANLHESLVNFPDLMQGFEHAFNDAVKIKENKEAKSNLK